MPVGDFSFALKGITFLFTQYPMDTKRRKVPVQIRVNMWLGLSAYEKKFNSFSEGTFSVFAEMVHRRSHLGTLVSTSN